MEEIYIYIDVENLLYSLAGDGYYSTYIKNPKNYLTCVGPNDKTLGDVCKRLLGFRSIQGFYKCIYVKNIFDPILITEDKRLDNWV